ncbi:acyl-homoserine-lactone synthase [Serratia ureilytica]|uniref:acyl-homoserine-lactone synthase n=1 Tax=Serratia ureilytica TaxID=300181 RepID=UPI001AA1CA8E|nr:acyl-homoserine-lactone synthase [Serratia ureilytica]MBO1809670.1 acyl-homoserine-lactone synthase [Serratia ureilytica]
MFELFDVSYNELNEVHSDELYRLRKTTFSDRLRWDVVCNHDMEFDEFDNSNAHYILGLYHGQLICSVRFIPLKCPNMITHTFCSCFNDVNLPPVGVESSRFFVDKARARLLLGERYPISQVLFLSMVNWAMTYQQKGIHTIVSRAMLTILKRSGWQLKVLKEAFLSEHERIYLVWLPVGQDEQSRIVSKLNIRFECSQMTSSLVTWPLSLPV